MAVIDYKDSLYGDILIFEYPLYLKKIIVLSGKTMIMSSVSII